MCGSKGVETWLTRTCNCVVGAREMSCEKAASLDYTQYALQFYMWLHAAML